MFSGMGIGLHQHGSYDDLMKVAVMHRSAAPGTIEVTEAFSRLITEGIRIAKIWENEEG